MNFLLRYYWLKKLKDNKFKYLFNTPQGDEYVSIDCETTSLDPSRAEIITIAATKVVNNRVLVSQAFHVKLKAPSSLTESSIKVHQIRHQDLGDGMDEGQAIEELLSFIGNRPIVGYHIRYDKQILNSACKKHLGFPLPNSVIEVSQLYQQKLEKHLQNAYFDLSLETICRHLDLPIYEQHDALQDSITAALIFVRLKKGELPDLSFPHITK
ncbi:3'-5' exonuclease [Vibrio gallicus]|uniref:3'-5' exonuclease n=1 Tax=Vibrio gallicus TaxID=190897 RepID=UPI0021C3AB1B|nr:3'-5' exonuclease [Vibrio gallicus]